MASKRVWYAAAAWHLMLCAVGLGVGSAHPQRPNFVFFMPDEMRAESMGVYGGPAPTPNFQRLASNGVKFEQCHTSYTVCSQSRAAFMTGWPTHVFGHRSLWYLLQQWEPNMLKYLKSAGYEVRWWGKNDMLAADSFPDSVDSAMSAAGISSLLARNIAGGNVSDPRYYSFLYEPLPKWAVDETPDARNVFKAIEFLKLKQKEFKNETTESKPFAVYLPLFLPHPPYTSPEPFYNLINRSEIPPLRSIGVSGKPDFHRLIREYRHLPSSEAFLRELHAVYLGSIAYSDYLLGKLLDALDETGLASTTNVFAWADHGDYAGDWGLVEKWPSGLEDVLTRVPLIAAGPSVTASRGTSIGPQPVQLFNLVPTVLELAHVTVNHTHFATSLVPELQGEPREPNSALPGAVFAEGGYGTQEPRDNEGWPGRDSRWMPRDIYFPKRLQQREKPLSVCRAVMVRTTEAKLILRMDQSDSSADMGHGQSARTCKSQSELYNLTADPRELENLFFETRVTALLMDLQEKILRWLFLTSDVASWTDDSRGTRKYPGGFTAGLSPDEVMLDDGAGATFLVKDDDQVISI